MSILTKLFIFTETTQSAGIATDAWLQTVSSYSIKMKSKLPTYAGILLILITIFSCKKQEVTVQKSINKTENGSIDSISSLPSKTLINDISEDNIMDTISITAQEGKTIGFDFEIKIKYSLQGEWKIKKIQSGHYTNAFDWGFESKGKWLSVDYATDRHYRDYYDIAFEKSENLFYLKRHIGVYPSSTEKYYDLFDEGGITVETFGFKICKTEYDRLVIKDTISLTKTKNTKCVELPYQEETSNKAIIERFFGLTKLESISK